GQKRSITHLEYLEARRLGKDVLIFLAAPETEGRDDLFPQDQRDTEQHGKQLKAFRAELERARAVAYFSTPTDLYEAVIRAVHQWLRSRPVGRDSVGREEAEAPQPPKNLRKFLDPRDPHAKRYPRPRGIQALRGVLLFCWLVVVGYLGTVIWNIYGLIHTGFADVTPDNLRAALELPGPLASADAPLWAEGLFAVGVVALAAACYWATRDRAIEHDVSEWRHKREIYERLPARGATPPVAVDVSGALFYGLEAPDDQHFVGREHDLAEVLERLRTRGLAAISGLGGVGKTALAGVALREVRETGEFPGGIVAVRCEGLTDPATVLRLVLERFGQPDGEMERETLDQLGARARRALAGKRALVALDNVEPDTVGPDNAEPAWSVRDVISRLREAGVALLLTSRQIPPRAAVPVEASYVLEVLAPEEALRLFAQSYGRPDTLDLTRAEGAAAERIVRALGYHTLAIKLEGANAADLALDLGEVAGDLEAHPERGLDLAEDEVPFAVQRAFARSIEKLPEGARRLFAALAAVPTAEFGRGAALALAGGITPPVGETALDLLVRRALAEAALDTTMPEGSDRQRLRLHLLMRAYATREFAKWAEKERRAASSALATFYAGYANETEDRALGPDEENITGMLEWAHAQGEDGLVAELTWGLAQFWRDTGRTKAALTYLPVGIQAAEAIADQTREREDRLRAARLLSTYGNVLQAMGRLNEAEDIHQRNLALRREVQDRRGEGIALSNLGQIALMRGRLEEAEGYFQQSLVIDREVQDRRGEGVVLLSLAIIAKQHGHFDEAANFYHQSLVICREVGDRTGEGVILTDLASIEADQNHDDEAELYFRQGLEALVETQEAYNRAAVSLYFGEFLITRRGKRDEGCAMLGEAARLFEAMGVPGAEEARETARRLGCGAA
ncbi:MAG TPA: tetratricopeptide repeat protein, partial [Ktedonobacterales bacterium]